MPITTFEGTVKDGRILLPDDLSLPDNTRVYVVVPDVANAPTSQLRSPRLLDPRDNVDFQKQVIAGSSNAGI